jgi:predicted ArsR family transcriptional regulator
LRERGAPVEIVQIAQELGIHANTVRFHLEALLERGQVVREMSEHHRPGRPAQVFSAAQVMDPTGPENYRLLADILVSEWGAEPDASPRALEAGRRWGRRYANENGDAPLSDSAAIDRLIEVLSDLDFAPERRESHEALPVIGLHHCPFLDLAHSRADVVCPIHLGLMRGVLEAEGAPITVDRLEAFVEPDLCAAHLVATT